jgi:hypothetical protein
VVGDAEQQHAANAKVRELASFRDRPVGTEPGVSGQRDDGLRAITAADDEKRHDELARRQARALDEGAQRRGAA